MKRDSFRQFRANRSKLCGNCAFPQNFHTRKLGEMSVIYAIMYCVYENTIREYDTNFYNLRNVTTNNHYFLKKLGSKYLKKSKMLQQDK